MVAAPDDPRGWSLADLGVRYSRRGRWALDHVSVEAPPGPVALLGPNGAGKTTLFRVLTTTLRPTTGSFTVAGMGATQRAERDRLRRRLGYLPQGFRAFGGFSCAQLVAYVAWLRRVPPAEVPDAVRRSLAAVGLDDEADTSVRTLSGGMRQRLGLAQALVNDPVLLLLDEPTVGLDPRQRSSLMAHLGEIAATRSVLMATHLVEDVAAFASTVVVLDRGQVVFAGSVRGFCALHPGDGPPTGPMVHDAYLRVVGPTPAS